MRKEIIFFFVSTIVSGLRQSDFAVSDFSHVVILPDIHGDMEALFQSLFLAVQKVDGPRKKVSSYNAFKRELVNFAQKKTHEGPKVSQTSNVALVQLGDVLDRGPHGILCLYILAGIEQVLGWTYVQLYGNHELINFQHMTHQYIHPQEWRMFPTVGDRFFEFSPGGNAHRLITEMSVGFVRLGTPSSTSVSDSRKDAATLFVHGGVQLDWIEENLSLNVDDLEALNFVVHSSITGGNRGDLNGFNEEKSFLWDRVLAQAPEPDVCDFANEILSRFDVARIVVGHTPQVDQRVKTRCGGSIVLTDVMMSRWMVKEDVDEEALIGGRPTAIVMEIDQKREELIRMVVHHIDMQGKREESYTIIGDGFADIVWTQVDSDGEFDDDKAFVDPSLQLEEESSDSLKSDTAGFVKALFGHQTTPDPMDFEEGPTPSPKRAREEVQRGQELIIHESVTIAEAYYRGMSGVVTECTQGVCEGVLMKKVAKLLDVADRFVELDAKTFFLGTISVSPVQLVRDPGQMKDILASIGELTQTLHGAGLVLGFTDADEVINGFGIDVEGDCLDLIDWSHLRKAKSAEDVDTDMEVIETALAILASSVATL
jgi:hypothetical protein